MWGPRKWNGGWFCTSLLHGYPQRILSNEFCPTNFCPTYFAQHSLVKKMESPLWISTTNFVQRILSNEFCPTNFVQRILESPLVEKSRNFNFYRFCTSLLHGYPQRILPNEFCPTNFFQRILSNEFCPTNFGKSVGGKK